MTSKGLSREEAIRLLSTPVRQLRLGQLRAVIGLRVPYHVFTVTRGETDEVLLAIDAVSGQLDLHHVTDPHLIDHEVIDIISSESRSTSTMRRVPARLSIEESTALVRERALRLAFLNGFFKIGNRSVNCSYRSEISVLYWVGVFERNDRVQIEVIDALRGKFEGAKVRDLATEYIQQTGAADALTSLQPEMQRVSSH